MADISEYTQEQMCKVHATHANMLQRQQKQLNITCRSRVTSAKYRTHKTTTSVTNTANSAEIKLTPSTFPVASLFSPFFQDLIVFLDKMAIPQVTLVGHDWGGALVWSMAQVYPERVR